LTLSREVPYHEALGSDQSASRRRDHGAAGETMRRRALGWRLLLILILTLGVVPGAARVQDDFYRGKTVRIVVGYD
jgi:hypothetical protein